MPSTPEHPGWLEISVNINPVAHEALSAFFFDINCEGIVSESFKDTILKAYLPFPEDLEGIRVRTECFLQKLKDIFPDVNFYKLNISHVEDEDWDIIWRRFFRPVQITQRLLIIPAWKPVPSALTCHVIRIDPGPAFGTGQHPTTRMCLNAMEKVCLGGSWTMLDVGTGSGILAIYGAKLGAGRVVAIDIDPEAVRWAKRNIELNDLPVEVELYSTPLENFKQRFSLIAGNLILGTILDLSSCFPRVMAPEGRLILSGILRKQIGEVEEKLGQYGLFRDQVLFQEEWACLILKGIG